MRLSRTGLALCAIYISASVAIWTYANMIAGDPKGTFVLMQIPIVFAHAAAWKLGLLPLMDTLPDLMVWALLFLPTLAVIYGIGWVAGLFFHALRPSA